MLRFLGTILDLMGLFKTSLSIREDAADLIESKLVIIVPIIWLNIFLSFSSPSLTSSQIYYLAEK